jgi:hypothetical protein
MELVDADLVLLYEVDRKTYLHIPRFRQRLRFHKGKYPLPPQEIECREIRQLRNEKSDLSPTQDGLKPDLSLTQVSLKSAEEKRREEKRNEEKKSVGAKAPARFVPPSLDDVKAYCASRGNAVSPEKWMAHYEANGWKVGRNPMKDWKAAVRTWEGNGIGSAAPETFDYSRLSD